MDNISDAIDDVMEELENEDTILFEERGRRFLDGHSKSTCLGAVQWEVEVRKIEYGNRPPKAAMDASIRVNEEGRSHWVTRRAELRPIRNLVAELNKFEEAVEKALSIEERFNENAQKETSD